MRPKGTKLELAIPYGVTMALTDMGRSIRHVVCQREALPRTRLREPQQFGPHVHVRPCFDKAIIGMEESYLSKEPYINRGRPVLILRVLLIFPSGFC